MKRPVAMTPLTVSFSVMAMLALSSGPFIKLSQGNDGRTEGATVSSETSANPSSVTRKPISRVLDQSKRIDALIIKNLKAKGLKPNAQVADDVFLRRVYLDIAGRIPTYQETIEFLKDESKNKRQHLIDKLLDSKGFESHIFNFYADLLRLKSRLRNVPGEPYIKFVKEAIAKNQPYDEFVRELLTAEGNYAEEGNGATGYYVRDFGMPEDNMSNTIRIFLGTRLECAQCHDHPFDVWTQRDYYEMVAFTGGVLTRVQPPFEDYNKLRQMSRVGEVDEKTRRNLQNILRPLSYGAQGSGTGLARLPRDYKESDGKANEIVKARTMFEKKELVVPEIPEIRNNRNRRNGNRRNNAIRNAKQINSRKAYADWMTSSENPRFTAVIANRMWKRAMGVGLMEPVDIITEETVPSNPELMTYLTQLMIDVDYDLKQFLRVVYNSKAYQQTACVSDDEIPTEYTFRGPLLRRMSGEQLWDSLLTFAIDKLDAREGSDPYGRRYGNMTMAQVFEKTKGKSPEQIMEMAKNPPPRPDRNAQRDKIRKRQAEIRQKFQNEYRELSKRQQIARRAKDKAELKKIEKELLALKNKVRKIASRFSTDMVRASELTSPARPGHLAREFGQSDREQIENSNKEPAVTQVLALMNGFVQTRIVANSNTALMSNIEAAESMEQKIDTIFLSILNRYPTREERSQWLDSASEDNRQSTMDLIWTLTNNIEFLFVQ